MATATQVLSRGVRPLILDAGGVGLSALLCEPERTPPRATVVALHGTGMRAGYFDGQAHPDLSLLVLGASLGFTVLAVDRPGYGASAGMLPQGQDLGEQSRTLGAALEDLRSRYDTGNGLFLLAHSFGGKLALTSAANEVPPDLLGVDVSGCGHRYAAVPKDLPGVFGRRHWRWNWGRLDLYPPNTFQSSGPLVADIPAHERRDAERWQETFDGLAPHIRVPVRFTFAEHELWWRHDSATLQNLGACMPSAPRVLVDRQPSAGHNLSLGWAARSYHLRSLGFLEECLLGRGRA